MTEKQSQERGATAAQLEAMHFESGQMLVLAGPGSGKTRVITGRIRYLIEEKHVPPQQILTITFTKSAALQMKRRACEECTASAQSVFGTFHSFFYQIIRTSGYYQGFSLLSPYQQKQILKACSGRFRIYDPEAALAQISYWKNTGSMPIGAIEDLKILSAVYTQECHDRRKLDFDDLLVSCEQVLLQNRTLLSFWQKRFTYLQIDEFQDINPVQYRIVKLLCGKEGNLLVVGDDDQSIYSFRGSSPSYMQTFLEDFPHAQKCELYLNFRCASQIIKTSLLCIRHNTERFDKQIKSPESAYLGSVQIREFEKSADETAYVIEKIRETGQNAAILVRTNAEMERFAAMLLSYKIPFFIREKRKSELDTEAVKDFLAFLRFTGLENSTEANRRADLLCFMNKPERGLSRRMLISGRVSAESVLSECKMQNEDELFEQFRMLFHKLEIAGGLDYYGALLFFWKTLGYESYVTQMDEQKREKNRRAIERLFSMKGLKKASEFSAFYEEYERGILTQPKASEELPLDRVVIMTYHGAKGLEFDSVYLPGVNEGAVPHGKGLSLEQTEEERRMFYVAITRAKKELLISYSSQIGESYFLKELKEGIGTDMTD